MDYISTMPKDPKKIRNEVHFLPDQQKLIEKLAKESNRSVKNFLETIILEYLNNQKKK
jgi:hypothetical protein